MKPHYCIVYCFRRVGHPLKRVVLVTNSIAELGDWPTRYIKDHPECIALQEMYLADLHDESIQ
jgi:hypothetical protein